MEELLLTQKRIWEEANKIGPTTRSWEAEEADIRKRYAELESMNEEDRDKAIVEGHLERAGMLEAVLNHIDTVLLPRARANERLQASRSIRRSKKKKSKAKATKKKKKGRR